MREASLMCHLSLRQACEVSRPASQSTHRDRACGQEVSIRSADQSAALVPHVCGLEGWREMESRIVAWVFKLGSQVTQISLKREKKRILSQREREREICRRQFLGLRDCLHV